MARLGLDDLGVFAVLLVCGGAWRNRGGLMSHGVAVGTSGQGGHRASGDAATKQDVHEEPSRAWAGAGTIACARFRYTPATPRFHKRAQLSDGRLLPATSGIPHRPDFCKDRGGIAPRR